MSRPDSVSTVNAAELARAGQAAMGERGLTDVASVPDLIRSVATAAAVSVGIAPNHGLSRKLRQLGWSYLYAA